MIKGLLRAVRMLFGLFRDNTLAGSPPPARGFPMRRFLLVVVALTLLAAGAGIYYYFLREPQPLVETPRFEDTGSHLPTQEEFDALAHSDPIKLLEACLT